MPAGHFYAHFGRGIWRKSKHDRCPCFIEIWRKNIQMFISGENSELHNRKRVLRAQNDTHYSLNFPIVSHALSCNVIVKLARGCSKSRKNYIHQHRTIQLYVFFNLCVFCRCLAKIIMELIESCMQQGTRCVKLI